MHELPYALMINRRIWAGIACLAATLAAWMAVAGMTLDISRVYAVFGICAMFAAISIAYRFLRRDDEIVLMGQLAIQWIAAAAALGVGSYVSARLSLPLTDETLIALDRMCFFDWLSYVAWVDAHPLVARAFSLSYMSSGPQIILMMALLFFTHRIAHMQKFLLAFMITGLLTVVFAALFPAVGGYVHYDIDISQYQHLSPVAARIHEAPLLSMRDHTASVLAFPLQGLVTFPSFHSALSIVLIYAAWPLRRLRYLSFTINMLVLFSTPVDGGHYLTDILGGVALAVIAIALVNRWIRPQPAPPTRAATR